MQTEKEIRKMTPVHWVVVLAAVVLGLIVLKILGGIVGSKLFWIALLFLGAWALVRKLKGRPS